MRQPTTKTRTSLLAVEKSHAGHAADDNRRDDALTVPDPRAAPEQQEGNGTPEAVAAVRVVGQAGGQDGTGDADELALVVPADDVAQEGKRGTVRR
jgi:hypothetical protein